LKLNEKDSNGSYPLYWAYERNRVEMVKLFFDYAEKKNIILELNEKDKNGNYPLAYACCKNNIEMVKLLFTYANNHNILIEMNKKDEIGNNPLIWTCDRNNIEIYKLLIDYANNNNIILNLNDEGENGNYPLYWACCYNNIELIQLLIDYANKNNIILEMNKKNKNEYYPIYWTCYDNNIKIFKLLIDYANKNSIILKLNEKDKNGSYPLLLVIENNNNEMIQSLIDYATINNIILDLNGQDKNGDYPLCCAYRRNNVEIIKLLIDYANHTHVILSLNEKDKNGHYPLFLACKNNNIKMMNLIIDYANENNIILKLNEKDNSSSYPLSRAFERNNIEMVKLLTDYANRNNIILELNEKDSNGSYPLSYACRKNNIEMIKLLFNYANNHNIVLEMNKNDKIGNNPLIWVCDRNNIDIFKLLIDYADKHKIILDLNSEGENGNYPLYWACCYNNIEMVKLFIDYANKNNFILELNKRNRNGYYPLYWAIFENNTEMIQLLIDYISKNNIILKFNERDYEKNSNVHAETIEILKNYKKEVEYESKNLVIAIDDFESKNDNQLDIKKNEILVVTNWNCEDKGLVYGYRKHNKEEKGMFPEIYIKRYNYENIVSIFIGKDNAKGEITPKFKIEFDRKVKKFRNTNKININNIFFNQPIIYINRKSLFYEAYNQIMNKTIYELKKGFGIKYLEEEGVDSGGLLRDFFYQISQEIGNPNYSLFQYSNTNSYELEINPMSSINPEHLNYFKFIGRIMGLAIFHKLYLPVNFTFLFYKKLLNKSLEFSDMEFIDPEIYKNIKWLLENDGTENLGLDFTLNIEDCFGNRKTIELKPGGANIDVTDSNKFEYINLVIKYKLNNTNDKEQLEALKKGFYEIIPKNINKTFNEFELKYLISGFNEIDVDDWKRNTDYEGYNTNDITIIYFWRCVREFSNENRKKLLLFATGSSQIPVTGFKDLQGSGSIQHFKLKRVISTDIQKALPISHTCFNRIDLPPYTNYALLKQKLLLAISEGIEGFSLA